MLVMEKPSPELYEILGLRSGAKKAGPKQSDKVSTREPLAGTGEESLPAAVHPVATSPAQLRMRVVEIVSE